MAQLKRLMKAFAHLIDRWIPSYGANQDNERNLTHKFYQFLCTIIAFFLALFSLNSLILGIYRLAFGQALIVAVIFLSVAVYRKTKSITLAANLIMMLSAPVSFYRAWVTGGIFSPILFGWPVISALALMTLPFSWTLIWTFVHLAFAGYFYFEQVTGRAPAITAPPAVIDNVRIAMIVTVQFILISAVFLVRRANQAHRARLRDQSERITQLIRTLSHDLSSPIMTLTHWVKKVEKSGQGSDPIECEETLKILKGVTSQIARTREEEAKIAGKLSSVHQFIETDPERQIAIQLFRFTIITLVSVYSTLSVYYFLIRLPLIGGLQAMVALVSAIAWIIFARTQSMESAGSFIMVFGASSGSLRAKLLGGIDSPAFLIWPIIPVFTGLLLSLRTAGFWTGVYIAIALYFDISHRLHIEFPKSISDSTSSQMRIIFLVVVQAMVVSGLYYLKRQTTLFRELTEKQRSKKLELLKALTTDIGGPLHKIISRISHWPQTTEVKNASRAAQASTEIIANIKGLSEIEELSFQSMNALVNLREVFQEVAFIQQEAFTLKQISFQESFPDDSQPLLVSAERTGLAYQVFNNLISNAIKFTDPGGTISLSVFDIGQNWKIVVRDNGIGIPNDIMTKLFDQNKQTTRLGTHGEKGTGFGMPIVKRFIEQYGGQVQVSSLTRDQSSKDHGTEVEIQLPKAPNPTFV